MNRLIALIIILTTLGSNLVSTAIWASDPVVSVSNSEVVSDVEKDKEDEKEEEKKDDEKKEDKEEDQQDQDNDDDETAAREENEKIEKEDNSKKSEDKDLTDVSESSDKSETNDSQLDKTTYSTTELSPTKPTEGLNVTPSENLGNLPAATHNPEELELEKTDAEPSAANQQPDISSSDQKTIDDQPEDTFIPESTESAKLTTFYQESETEINFQASSAAKLDDLTNDSDFQASKAASESGEIASQPDSLKSTAGTDSTEANNKDTASTSALLTETASDSENLATDSAQIVTSAADLTTGDALATANLLQLINVWLDNSTLLMDAQDVDGVLDVDLNELWLSLLASEASTSQQQYIATTSATQVEADIDDNVSVVADTGNNNQISDGDTILTTGSATAVANLTSLVNSWFINTKLLISTLNLLPDFQGSLILPRLTNFLGGQNTIQAADDNWLSLGENTWLTSYQNNTALVIADTGHNQLQAGSETLLNTGEATAIANVANIANSSFNGVSWYVFWLNIGGSWNGQFYGSDAESELSLYLGNNQLGINSLLGLNTASNNSSTDSSTNNSSPGCDSPSCLDSENLSSQGSINNQIEVVANTGHNFAQASGSATMKTGHALSILNLFNVINSVFANSRIFMSTVNILGSWTGNIFFAYPELAVDLASNYQTAHLGEIVTYSLTYQNTGFDAVDDAKLIVNLPAGAQLLRYQGSIVPEQLGNSWVWEVGELEKGEGGRLNFEIKVDDWGRLASATSESGSWWQSLMPIAQASSTTTREEKEINLVAQILTQEEQYSGEQNQDSETLTVYREIEIAEPGEATNQDSVMNQNSYVWQDYQLFDYSEQVESGQIIDWPLFLEMENNVNEFVYTGDVVTFSGSIINAATEPIFNAVLYHQILDENNEVVVELEMPIGFIPANKRGQVSFGLQMPPAIPVENWHLRSVTQIQAMTESGNYIFSGVAETNFGVKTKLALLSAPLAEIAQPPNPENNQPAEGEVLGAKTVKNVKNQQSSLMAHYLLGALLLFLIGIRLIRRRLVRPLT